ncbi:unnamed protein product [Choristocarpus tenellus]
MGKARKKKDHRKAARAAADSATAASATELLGPLHQGKDVIDMSNGVLDGLGSLNDVTRESSCAAIASLFEKVDIMEAGAGTWSVAQRLIAGGLVKKMLSCVQDRAPEVKVQATGALRNISAVRDPRVCEVMVNDDCLTPVLTLLDRMTMPTRLGAEEGEGGEHGCQLTPEQDQIVMTQLVATLCNLLAAVEVAVMRFTNQGGLQVLMQLLTPKGSRGCAEIFSGALQALHVATDSNPELVHQLVALPGATDGLTELVQGTSSLPNVSSSMRLQAAGILVNAAGLSAAANTEEGQAELGRLIIPLVVNCMAYDPGVLESACATLAATSGSSSSKGEERGRAVVEMDTEGCSDHVDIVGTIAASAASKATSEAMNIVGVSGVDDRTGEAESDKGIGNGEGDHAEQPDMDAKIRWEWKLKVAEPLKLSAEVMTNLCALAAGEEEGEGEEEEWGSDDEEAMERVAKSADVAMSEATTARGTWSSSENPRVLLQAIVDAGAILRVMGTLQSLLSPTPRDRANAGAEGTDGGEEEGKDVGMQERGRLALPSGTAADLADLRRTVALCAANLVQNLPLSALGDPQPLWSNLCTMCEEAAIRAPSCVEPLTSIMWGLVRRVGPAVMGGAGATVMVTAEAATLLLRLCDRESTPAFEARVNAVGMLGLLGTLSGAGGAEEGNLVLANALVRVLEDPHVLVQAEALNAIMDIYGDDSQDPAFRAAGMLTALATAVPGFRRKVKQEGSPLGRDALCHLKETSLNASRFVKYKRTAVAEGDKGAGM